METCNLCNGCRPARGKVTWKPIPMPWKPAPAPAPPAQGAGEKIRKQVAAWKICDPQYVDRSEWLGYEPGPDDCMRKVLSMSQCSHEYFNYNAASNRGEGQCGCVRPKRRCVGHYLRTMRRVYVNKIITAPTLVDTSVPAQGSTKLGSALRRRRPSAPAVADFGLLESD